MPSSDRPKPHPEHQPSVEIIVNSRARQVSKGEISYAEVLELAFPGVSNSETVIYTISYEGAAGQPPHEGTLAVGATVKIRKGTCFNVIRTDRS
jgi:hypothetical protein